MNKGESTLFEDGLNALFDGGVEALAQADAQEGGQQLRLALRRGAQEQVVQHLELVLRARVVQQMPVLTCSQKGQGLGVQGLGNLYIRAVQWGYCTVHTETESAWDNPSQIVLEARAAQLQARALHMMAMARTDDGGGGTDHGVMVGAPLECLHRLRRRILVQLRVVCHLRQQKSVSSPGLSVANSELAAMSLALPLTTVLGQAGMKSKQDEAQHWFRGSAGQTT